MDREQLLHAILYLRYLTYVYQGQSDVDAVLNTRRWWQLEQARRVSLVPPVRKHKGHKRNV